MKRVLQERLRREITNAKENAIGVEDHAAIYTEGYVEGLERVLEIMGEPMDSEVAYPQVDTDMNPKGSVEVSIASTIIPWDRDDERALYFGYRASGLSVREALHMIQRSKPWLSLQRHDEIFVALESRIPEFRRELSKEYVEIEFFRNFRLVLEKDHQVLWKSLKKDEVLTKYEQEYLIKLRSQYSPAQIQILEAVANKDDGFNFARFVAEHPDIVQLSRTDTITMARRDDDS